MTICERDVVVERAVEVDPLAVGLRRDRGLREPLADRRRDVGRRRPRRVLPARTVGERDRDLLAHGVSIVGAVGDLRNGVEATQRGYRRAVPSRFGSRRSAAVRSGARGRRRAARPSSQQHRVRASGRRRPRGSRSRGRRARRARAARRGRRRSRRAPAARTAPGRDRSGASAAASSRCSSAVPSSRSVSYHSKPVPVVVAQQREPDRARVGDLQQVARRTRGCRATSTSSRPRS